MAGTLTISTLSDGTNSSPVTDVVRGSARVWVNFNGIGTVAIMASYNVSSITDNGTGDYTINFSSAFVDSYYAYVTGGADNDYFGDVFISEANSTSRLAGSLRLQFQDDSGNQFDTPCGCVSIFR